LTSGQQNVDNFGAKNTKFLEFSTPNKSGAPSMPSCLLFNVVRATATDSIRDLRYIWGNCNTHQQLFLDHLAWLFVGTSSEVKISMDNQSSFAKLLHEKVMDQSRAQPEERLKGGWRPSPLAKSKLRKKIKYWVLLIFFGSRWSEVAWCGQFIFWKIETSKRQIWRHFYDVPVIKITSPKIHHQNWIWRHKFFLFSTYFKPLPVP